MSALAVDDRIDVPTKSAIQNLAEAGVMKLRLTCHRAPIEQCSATNPTSTGAYQELIHTSKNCGLLAFPTQLAPRGLGREMACCLRRPSAEQQAGTRTTLIGRYRRPVWAQHISVSA